MTRWGRWLTAALATLSLGGTAAAQSTPVPASWKSYAGLVGHQFQAWLMADDDVAWRLHKFLEDRAVSAADTPPGPLLVKVWINSEGQVTQLDFASLGSSQADVDLRQLLTTNPLSEPPPPDMRQPLMLRLDLQFKS
ncbi:MAG: hypothetical protein NVV74_03620 [Magnetospirillum sp.]|nr:hypothetical protein [Magnetospirillum sp.]